MALPIPFLNERFETCDMMTPYVQAVRRSVPLFCAVVLYVSICDFHLLEIFSLILPQLLCLATYRLRFHQLAKYPGPLVAGLTDLYSIYNCWRGDSHLTLYQNHCKYGHLLA